MKNLLLIGDSIRAGYDKSVRKSLEGKVNIISDKMANISKIFSRRNGDVEKYNEEAIKIVKKHGFEVNDLYTFSASLPEEYHSDAVHYYTPEGTKAFTNQVLSCLLPVLGIDEKIEYREELHTDKPVGA